MTTVLIAAVVLGEKIALTLVAKGMTRIVGGYVPVRAEMGAEPKSVKKSPGNLGSPQYGTIAIGDQAFAFILDEPVNGAARLYVDSNGDGDLTNDPATVWESKKQGELTMHSGTAQVMVDGTLAGLGVYRFDKNDPNRPQLKNTLLYYTDFGYEGTAKFGKDSYKLVFAGPLTEKAGIFVDRNGNGKNDGPSESLKVGTPFNFRGKVYVLSISSGSLVVNDSDADVAEIPLPPDLSVGKDVPAFKALDMDGKAINFPSTYKGKVVLLDFWATWCGPCIAELPNLTKAYEKYHSKGFEILGVSFDKENMAEQVKAFTKEKNMPWQQVYEGKFWDTTLGRQFNVRGIPFCLLVDGDTGKILAGVDKLRGENLEKTLSQVMGGRNQ